MKNREDQHNSLHIPGLPKLAKEVAEAIVKGSGHYLEQKIAATETVMDAYKRINASAKNGSDKTSSFVCGSLGAIAQTTTALTGNGIVFSTASAIVAETGGVGLIPAAIFAKKGFEVVEPISKKAGDLTQSACHAAYNVLNEKSISDDKVKIASKDLSNNRDKKGINPETQFKLEKKLKTMGVSINKPLKEELQKNKKSQQQLKLICDYLKTQEKTAEIKGYHDACGMIGELGSRFGDRGLGKLTTFVQSGLQINMFLDTVKTATSIGAALPSVIGIPLAIMNCVSLLMDDDEEGNQSQFFIDLFERYCAKLHAHLDFIHDDLSKKIILGFAENKHNQGNNIDYLKKIYKEIQNSRIESRDRLDTLSNKIQSIANRQRTSARTKRLAEIYEYINLTTGPHQLSSETFTSLFNKYKTEICNIHKSDSTLIGIKGARATLLKDFEDDNDVTFGCDFNISPFHKYITSTSSDMKPETFLINPTVYSWEILGFMKLLESRYKKDEKAENIISKSELKVLEDALAIGQSTKSFSSALNNKTLIKKLLSNYVESGNKFLQQLKSYIQNQEKEVNKKLHDAFIKNTNAFNKGFINQFKAQKIEFDTQANKRWFSGYHANNHPNFCNGKGNHFGNTGTSLPWIFHNDTCCEIIDGHYFTINSGSGYRRNVESSVDNYLNERKKSLNEFQNNYTKPLLDLLAQSQLDEKPVIETNFKFNSNYFNEFKIKPHYYYRYALPKETANNNYTLILPLPKHYHFHIPSEIQDAEGFEIGNVGFEYSTTQIENKDQFILECFYKEDQKYLLSTLKLPFDASIYKGNEALWWWWVGGNYSKNGADTFSVVYRWQQPPEGNIWRTKAWIPTCENHKGKHEELEMKDGKLINAEEDDKSFDTIYLRFFIPDKIENKIKDMIKDLYENISREILNNEQSELSKSVIEYSFNFYLLKFSLQLGFGEKNYNKIYDLSFFLSSKNEKIGNRLDLINFLKNEKEFLLINNLEETLRFVKKELSAAINKLFQIPKTNLFPSLLADTMDCFSKLIEWYKPRAVDENQLASKVSKEKQLEEQNKIQTTLIQSIGEALLALPKDQQQPLLNNILKNAASKGLLSSSISTLFLPAPSNNNSKPNGVNSNLDYKY